jgi:hypothetical protein
MKILLKFSLFILTFGSLSHGVFAQTERSQDFNESWNGIKNVNVDHRYGTLEIIPHSGSEVKLVASILVHAREDADAQALIDHFEIKSTAFGNKLEINTKFNTKSWTTNNNNTKIRFSDGTKVTGIKKIEIKYQLHVPSLETLEISNKYNNIEITSNFTGDLKVKQYDATLKIQDISGKLDLYLKYGKAYIGTVGDLMVDIYDSKAEIVKAQNVTIKSKYSNIELGEINSAEIDSYDGYCKIESVAGDLHINDKYSTYAIGSVENAYISLYDGKLRLDEASEYSGSSKYSAYDLKEIGILDLESTHDDHFNIQSLGTFSCNESKYTSFEIGTLTDKVIIASSYDSEFIVSVVSPSFKHFEIDCKYTMVKLPLTTLPGYQINAKMKYGKLSYPEPSENIVHKESNEQLVLRAQVGDTGSEAKVIINSYDSNIRLK